MKTLTIVIGCAMTMAVLTACSDNTDNPAPKPEQESQAEYTIMPTMPTSPVPTR